MAGRDWEANGKRSGSLDICPELVTDAKDRENEDQRDEEFYAKGLRHSNSEIRIWNGHTQGVTVGGVGEELLRKQSLIEIEGIE